MPFDCGIAYEVASIAIASLIDLVRSTGAMEA